MGNLQCNAMDDDETLPYFKITAAEEDDATAIEEDEPTGLQGRMQTLDRNVFIGVDFSPSPSPYVPFISRCQTGESTRTSFSSRLPGTQNLLPRSKSEHVRKGKDVKVNNTKRSSLPTGLIYGNVPNMVVITQFRDLYFSELSNPSTPNFFQIKTDTSRSRPMDTPVKFTPRYGWHMCLSPSNKQDSMDDVFISGKFASSTFNLASDGSDSQFAFNVPVLSPIFSNKVATFAAKDQELQNSIVNEINLQEFAESEFYDPSASEDSLAQLIDLLEASSSSSACGTVHTSSLSPSRSIGGCRIPSLKKKIRVSPSRSVGGFTLPDTPLSVKTLKRLPNSRSISPVSQLKTLAADLSSGDLAEFEKDLEEIARKYRMKKISVHAK